MGIPSAVEDRQTESLLVKVARAEAASSMAAAMKWNSSLEDVILFCSFSSYSLDVAITWRGVCA